MRNCVEPCHLLNVDGQINPSLVVVLVGLECMLCGQASRTAIILICDKCFQGWDMGCFMPPMEEVPIGKCFAFSAPNRPKFLRLHSRINPRFSSMVIHIWLGI